MAVETTHSLLVALNLALSPWPRYPERQSPCQGLKFYISFPKQFSRWVLLLSEVGTFKPLYTHSQRDAHTEYPLSCVTKGRVSWEGRQLGDKTPSTCVLPVVRVPGWEGRLLETMQLPIGEFITDSSQGLPPSPRVWGRKAPSSSSLGYLLGTIISWCEWIGYTVGSWCKWIGYTVTRQFLLS